MDKCGTDAYDAMSEIGERIMREWTQLVVALILLNGVLPSSFFWMPSVAEIFQWTPETAWFCIFCTGAIATMWLGMIIKSGE